MWKKIKHFFVPCEENTFKPHLLERFSMGVMLVLVVLTFTVSNLQALLWISSDWMVSTILPAVIVDLTNEERGEGALGTLVRSDVLDKAATLKAQDMATHGYFAHHSPTGVTPWHWFDEAGYNFVHAGENLAVRFTDSGDVVDAWMNSPAHKANIMNGTYTEIGVGTARGTYKGAPTIFVVQLFGTPKAVDVVPMPESTVVAEVVPSAETLPLIDETNVLSEQISEMEKGEETVLQETTYTEVASEEGVRTIYTGFASTTREGVPAVMDNAGSTGPMVGTLERSATQPGVWLQFVYALLGLVVVGALITSMLVEWRRQNPIQIAYASGLLGLMLVLFHIHTMLTSGVTIM
jgi:hypothetical protein